MQLQIDSHNFGSLCHLFGFGRTVLPMLYQVYCLKTFVVNEYAFFFFKKKKNLWIDMSLNKLDLLRNLTTS